MNRAQNLRARFSEAGVDLHPRANESGNPWQFSWRTTGFGRADRMAAIGTPASPAVNGTRVTYTHASAIGPLSEWYENRAEGLEQGFTLHERPPGQGQVRIEGTLADGLRAEASAPNSITFFDEQNAAVLEYGHLAVWDAHHKDVPATLALASNTLAIVIDDRGAEYPLLVDPIFTAPAWISDLDQFEGDYGFAVATAGDVNQDGYSDVLVGALQYDNGETNEGGAFLFMGSADGLGTKPVWSTESNQVEGRLAQMAAAGDVNGDGYRRRDHRRLRLGQHRAQRHQRRQGSALPRLPVRTRHDTRLDGRGDADQRLVRHRGQHRGRRQRRRLRRRDHRRLQL